MNPDTYDYDSFSPDVIDLMGSCEILSDLGDEFSWELVFELAGQVEGMGVTGYQKNWKSRQAMRKHLLKAMNHRSPKGEEA